MKKLIVKQDSNFHGSIAMVVLVACLFITVFCVMIYTVGSNQKQVQQKDYHKIENTYQASNEQMDQIYQNIAEKEEK
jgi:predicted PurR-regulated permease PerM